MSEKTDFEDILECMAMADNHIQIVVGSPTYNTIQTALRIASRMQPSRGISGRMLSAGSKHISFHNLLHDYKKGEELFDAFKAMSKQLIKEVTDE